MSATLKNATATLPAKYYVVRRTEKSGGGAILALRSINSRSKRKYFWSKKNREDIPPAVFENRDTARKTAVRYGGGDVCEFVN